VRAPAPRLCVRESEKGERERHRERETERETERERKIRGGVGGGGRICVCVPLRLARASLFRGPADARSVARILKDAPVLTRGGAAHLAARGPAFAAPGDGSIEESRCWSGA
jgi:hypothetical protein